MIKMFFPWIKTMTDTFPCIQADANGKHVSSKLMVKQQMHDFLHHIKTNSDMQNLGTRPRWKDVSQSAKSRVF